MTAIEIRQQVHQQIDRLPPEQLALVAEFLEFLQFKLSKTIDASTQLQALTEAGEPVLTGPTVADLVHAATWQRDDFEECLQAVYDTRLPAEF